MKSSETKAAALKMIAEGDYPIDAAAKLEISITTVRLWCIAADVQFKIKKRGRIQGPTNPIGIRKETAALVAAGATLKEAGRRMGMSGMTARKCALEFGVARRAKRGRRPGTHASNRRLDWDNVDWDKTTKELAIELGVSQQRVRQKRQECAAKCADPITNPTRTACGTATR